LGQLGPDSAMPITSQDKKFRHVPRFAVFGQACPPGHKGKSRQLTLDRCQKRLTAGFTPIKRKIGIAKPAILPYVDRDKLAEVVNI
jgi:hypothetical protein